MTQYVLALDQGTTSSRAIVFDASGRAVASAQQEFTQHFPRPGWVEHDAREIWRTQLDCARGALQQAGVAAKQLAAIGITNQRETTLLWDRASGEPVAPAIVWQDRRTADRCAELRAQGVEPRLREKTGLLLDPYFAATKLEWLLAHGDGLRQRAERGDLAFGTVDSWLVWKLTAGKVHVTDVSNASRTLLFDVSAVRWDDELLALFGVPRALLPAVVASSAVVGHCDADVLGAAIPIAGIAGDQQAATFGQACFAPGMAKNTYGTGAFMLMNVGPRMQRSDNKLLATIGWQLTRPQPRLDYMLEGGVFIAGAVVQWLRDGLGLFASSDEIESLARQAPDNGGVSLVPAFVGLGAPHWDPAARGLMIGLTRGTTKSHIARAALESIALQSADVLHAMQRDAAQPLTELRVDGGAARNDLLMQFQADIMGVPVVRPKINETTALGAAYLAGLATGVWSDTGTLAQLWQAQRRFEPQMPAADREERLQRWRRAIERARDWSDAAPQ